jgi:hypothetical protein
MAMSNPERIPLSEMLNLIEQLSPRELLALHRKVESVSKVKKNARGITSAKIRLAQARPIWEKIEEMTSKIPDKYFKSLPVDGASKHDKYLYTK